MHLNFYQANTKRPKFGLLGLSPPHFRDQNVISYDNNG